MIPLALALLLNPQGPVIADSVDVIERNSFHGEEAKPVFVQWIFWEFAGHEATAQEVVAWRMERGRVYDVRREDGRVRMILLDGNDLRRIDAPCYSRTWTQYDPEVERRRVLSQERRRELTKGKP